MKNLALLLFLCLSNIAISQVYGDIFMDKRTAEHDIDYTISYSKAGKLVFDIKVNVDGKVTSCILDEDKSTIVSTGPMMKAKNKIMQNLVFKKGVGYPQWHSGYVQITTVQNKKVGENKYAPPH